MNQLKGYRTLTVMALGLIYAALAQWGIVVPENDQAAIATGIVSLLGFVLRFYTDTGVGSEK